MVDLSVFDRQRSIVDQQQLQEAFRMKKQMQQLQELGAMAELQKSFEPQAMTPYQAASLALQGRQLEQKSMPMWSQANDPQLGMIQRNLQTGEVKPLKTPETMLKEEKLAKGKQIFEDSLANMAAKYDALRAGGGVSSVKDSGLSNLMTGIQTSAGGQAAGKLFGTENQSNRNQIAADIPLLTNAIKEATGMSAQQMNSNVELQTFLKALGNPENDYESNMAILQNLSRKFGTGEVARAKSAPQGGGWQIEQVD
jgi:hypothetical protein